MDFHTFDVSFTFIAMCAASIFVFTAWIGVRRGKTDVLRADGGDAVLFKRSRVHGNFIENAPFVALGLFAAEALGVADAWLWAVVVAFFVGRFYHAIRYDSKDRALGMMLTNGPSLALGVYVVLHVNSVL